jgi:hypothetical protein
VQSTFEQADFDFVISGFAGIRQDRHLRSGREVTAMKKPHDKKRYTAPKVDTLSAKQLHEAVGPAQGLSSGAPALVPGTSKKTKNRGRGHGHGRGHR